MLPNFNNSDKRERQDECEMPVINVGEEDLEEVDDFTPEVPQIKRLFSLNSEACIDCHAAERSPSNGNTNALLGDAISFQGSMQTSYYTDKIIDNLYSGDKRDITHGGSVYINMASLKPIRRSFPDVLHRITIAGLTPFGKDEDLFAALDKSSVDLFVARNQNQRGWSDIPLAITHFRSNRDAINTSILFTDFLKNHSIVCDEIVENMFYKCYHSQGFSSVAIHVKLYYQGENPIMEFRRVQGSPEIFFNIYGSFRNLMFGETNPVSMNPPHCDMLSEKVLMSKEEEEANIDSLLIWLKSSPSDAIKAVSQVAMEKDKDNQKKMCSAVFDLLKVHKDLSVLMAQTLGFINVIQGDDCLLDEAHKIHILSELKTKLQASLGEPNIPVSVRQRAERFIAEEIKSA